MLALTGAFRAVARRQACRLPAVATRSVSTQPSEPSASLEPLPEDDIEDMHDLTDKMHELSEDQATIQAGVDGSYEEFIVEYLHGSSSNPRSFPILKGFEPNRFVQPRSFSRDEYNKLQTMKRRPALGPDAATSKEKDIFYQHGLNPLNEAQNSVLMSRFVTSMGMIRKRSETNLTWKNQRRIAKAIRRAKMMGIIPVLSKRQLFKNDFD